MKRDPYALIAGYPAIEKSEEIKTISWTYEWKLLAYRNM
jgi:hypothetical protein